MRQPRRVEGEEAGATEGGDEFTVLLEEVTDLAEAVTVGERLLVAIRQPLVLAGRHLAPGASVGIAVRVGEAGITADALLQAVDTALYQAKSDGKDRVEVFDAGMQQRVSTRMEIESDLRRAVKAPSLIMDFQRDGVIAQREVDRHLGLAGVLTEITECLLGDAE